MKIRWPSPFHCIDNERKRQSSAIPSKQYKPLRRKEKRRRWWGGGNGHKTCSSRPAISLYPHRHTYRSRSYISLQASLCMTLQGGQTVFGAEALSHCPPTHFPLTHTKSLPNTSQKTHQLRAACSRRIPVFHLAYVSSNKMNAMQVVCVCFGRPAFPGGGSSNKHTKTARRKKQNAR